MTPINRARWIIVILGLILPYVARVPGMFMYGDDWLMSYIMGGLGGLVFILGFNAITWGTVLLMTIGMKHARSAWFPAVLGFAVPLLGHATLDLAADAQAAIALIFIPMFGVPGALIGGVIGQWYDRRLQKRV